MNFVVHFAVSGSSASSRHRSIQTTDKHTHIPFVANQPAHKTCWPLKAKPLNQTPALCDNCKLDGHSDSGTFILALLLLSICQATLATGLIADDSEQVAFNHGPAIVLQQNVVQSSNAARLLAVAERQLQIGNQDIAFDALMALFASNDADFPIVNQNAGNASVYDMGISLLRSASTRTRSAWSNQVEAIARVDLKRTDQTSAELQLAARKYPFTESGLHAQLLLIRNMITRQQNFTAAASVRSLEQQYAGISVNFPARPLITMAAQLVQQRSLGQTSPETIAAELPINSTPALAISSWQPTWKWTENIWQTSQITGTFGGLLQPNARSALASNSWQPALSNNQLIVRTPIRIVCLDLLTGIEQWSINTDTITQNTYEKLLESKSQPSQSGQLTDVLRSNDLGSITRTEDFLFFVDDFRIFETENNARNVVKLRFNRNPELDRSPSLKGGRLVAVRLTNPPTVAWTTGSQSEFQYQATTGKSGRPTADRDEETKQTNASEPASRPKKRLPERSPNGSFEGHRFLGPPLLFEQTLFVLTADDENVWLNSVMKGTGRLSWRRPITYQNSVEDDPSQRFQTKAEDVGASVVGIHNNTILCLLNTGVVIGASLPDGRVKWLTSLKRKAASEIPLPRSARYLRETSSTPAFPPILSEGRLLWMAAGSDDLSCLNASTGAIQWQISRVSSSPGQADRSKDFLPAGIINDQLIMTGNRHVRAINLSDGKITWTTGLNSPCGKAVLLNNTCWVPTLDGSVIPVNATSGSIGIPIETNEAIAGSLYHSDNRIVATTPISVSAFPLFPNTSQASASATNNPEQKLATALNAIQQAVMVTQLEADASSAILEGLSSLPEIQQQLVVDQALTAAVNNDRLGALAKASASLSMTKAQSVRQNILLHQQQQATTPDKLVRLSNDWYVRTDLAALAVGQPVSKAFAVTDINKIIRQPASVQSMSVQRDGLSFQQLAKNFFSIRPAAAELALLMHASTNLNRAEKTEVQNELHALRNQWVSKEMGVPSRTTKQAGLTNLQIDSVNFESDQDFRLVMTTPMTELTGLSRQPITIATPSPWPGRRLFLQDRQLFSVNLNAGTVSKSLSLPASPDRLIQGATPLDPLTASLLPIVGQSHAGIVSLVNQGEPKQLWWKRWDRALYDNSPLRSGPITAAGIIFASNQRITCLHPLTGATQWSRDFSAGSTESVFSRQVGFAANSEHLIAFGPGYRSGTVFQMATGRLVNTLSYDVPAEITPIVSGSRILFPKQQRLNLVDLATGTDLLADLEIKIFPDSSAQLLSKQRAVVITDKREVAVLNLSTAQLESKVQLSLDILKERSSGIYAFEDHDRIMILFRQWNARSRELSATSVVGDQRLTSGTLLSIQPDTGEQWSIPIPSSVLMEIAGDPAPVLLMWSRKSHRNSIPQGFGQRNYSPTEKEDHLLLRILDRQTGKELFRSENLGWGNPLRCFHDSESQTITIETDASVIRLRYTGQTSDPE